MFACRILPRSVGAIAGRFGQDKAQNWIYLRKQRKAALDQPGAAFGLWHGHTPS
jgi:hypothetical protein